MFKNKNIKINTLIYFFFQGRIVECVHCGCRGCSG